MTASTTIPAVEVSSSAQQSNSAKAQAAIEKFLDATDAACASYFEACVHCGECADACHFYLATNDPKFTPINKLQPMINAYQRHKAPLSSLKRLIGLAPADPTFEELEDWSKLVYDACNMCGRCTVVCPMGIDIAGTIAKMREGFVAVDLAPGGLLHAQKMALETGSPMGVKLKALKAQIKHQEDETGIPIQLDKKGADYMVILSSMEIMGYSETIGALARIFKQAEVDWTISSKTFEATNIGVQIGSKAVARELVQRVVDAAEELDVKYVIAPECGHAFGALRWSGPNLIGRPYGFEVIHIIELLEQLRREGRLRIKQKDTRVLTLHDPCQIVRRGGLLNEPRHVIEHVSSGLVELEGSGLANLCCGGGGGVSANPRAAQLQTAAFSCKKAQLKDMGDIDGVVVPCANCRTVFEEGFDEYDMELPTIGLTELVAGQLAD